MNHYKIIISSLLTLFASQLFGQIDNAFQPDSVYSTNRVNKIYVYLNSKRDLSKIISLNQEGKIVKTVEYSASYNKRTRTRKSVNAIQLYSYNNDGKLLSVHDSVGKENHDYFYSDNEKLDSSRLTRGNFTYRYSYYSDSIVTVSAQDSIIVYKSSKTFDRNFYVNRVTGYNLQPTTIKDSVSVDGKLQVYTSRDQSQMIKYVNDKNLENTFDENGKLISSKVSSLFMTNRSLAYDLTYHYYRNGLLKSIRGYVPRFYKYEYFK